MNVNSAACLLVSSDRSLIDAVEQSAAPIRGCEVEVVEGFDDACARIGRGDLAMTLIHLPVDGREQEVSRLLQMSSYARPSTTTLVVSDVERPKQALGFIRQGVTECLSRPLDLDRLTYLMDILTVNDRLGARKPAPAPEVEVDRIPGDGGDLPFLFCPSEKMGRVMGQIRRVATQDATILLGGETGTGKSRLAKVIHQLSGRGDEPLLTINCGALSATLIESEMFGHVKGAFTGADTDRVGKFAAVGQGTLFLDEVDSLPLALQAKLLRAVEERVFEPVGSNTTQPMRARLIAACNRPLCREVAEGRFRSDLYYRLDVVGFELPPLRDRREVIPALARTFLEEYSTRGGRAVPGIDERAMRALKAASWPGNLRELRNVMERAIALCSGDLIRLDDLPDHLADATPAPRSEAKAAPEAVNGNASLAGSRQHAERERIVDALEKHGNNRLRAAAELGISRMTLYNKLRKLSIG